MTPILDELVRAATQRIADLTGLPVSTVTGMAREEDRWRLSLELVEKQSIPRAMDILGRYDVWLDDQGSLLAFERRELRKRCDTSGQYPAERG